MIYSNAEDILEASKMLDSGVFADNILMVIGIYFIFALIGTAIAFCVVIKISDIEGRKAFFVNIPKCKKQGYKLITVPLVVAMTIVVLYMTVTEILLSLV